MFIIGINLFHFFWVDVIKLEAVNLILNILLLYQFFQIEVFEFWRFFCLELNKQREKAYPEKKKK